MPITIGQKPESSFSDPLGLLGDCHRRIETFLSILVKVTTQARGGRLNPEQREALIKALRYFREAAPNHTRDEEVSLFPRMRASGRVEVRAAFDALENLEAEHLAAERAHAEVESLGQRWLAEDRLTPAGVERLFELLEDSRKTYERHIAVEDSTIFPLAGRILKDQLTEVGREMASRRGVKPEETV